MNAKVNPVYDPNTFVENARLRADNKNLRTKYDIICDEMSRLEEKMAQLQRHNKSLEDRLYPFVTPYEIDMGLDARPIMPTEDEVEKAFLAVMEKHLDEVDAYIINKHAKYQR